VNSYTSRALFCSRSAASHCRTEHNRSHGMWQRPCRRGQHRHIGGEWHVCYCHMVVLCYLWSNICTAQFVTLKA